MKKNPAETEITEIDDNIEILGAREHNLKNLNVKIPRNKLMMITELSGSAKGNCMLDMQLSTDKLVDRATKMVMAETALVYTSSYALLTQEGSALKNVAKHNSTH